MGKTSYLCNIITTLHMLALFKQYLQTKNITPTDDNETITFVYKDLYYLFVSDKSDPNYFRLIIPNIYKAEDEDAIAKFKNLVNSINLKFKVAKSFITDNGMVWTSVEQFVYSTDNIERLFERSLVLLDLIVGQFREEQNLIKQ